MRIRERAIAHVMQSIEGCYKEVVFLERFLEEKWILGLNSNDEDRSNKKFLEIGGHRFFSWLKGFDQFGFLNQRMIVGAKQASTMLKNRKAT